MKAHIFDNQKDLDNHWFSIKDEVLEDMGYDEDDCDNDSIEDKVNRETDKRFKKQYGVDYINAAYYKY